MGKGIIRMKTNIHHTMLTNDLDINNIRLRETIEMRTVISTTITNTLELQPITHLQLSKHKVVAQCVD